MDNLTQKQIKIIEDAAYDKIYSFIHFKFGNCLKQYYFTNTFRQENFQFVSWFENYWKEYWNIHNGVSINNHNIKALTFCFNHWKKLADKFPLNETTFNENVNHRLFLYSNIDDKLLATKEDIENYIKQFQETISLNEEIVNKRLFENKLIELAEWKNSIVFIDYEQDKIFVCEYDNNKINTKNPITKIIKEYKLTSH